MELDARRLYLAQGFSSLFTYCTQALRLSEHAAYCRIEAARAARRIPRLLDLLADGSLTLTTVCLLAPHFTDENQTEILEMARHKSKRAVEQLVASLHPKPPVVSIVRKLPANAPRKTQDATATDLLNLRDCAASMATGYTAAPSRLCPATIAPLAPETFRVQFTMSREMHERLRRAQDLLRHVVPSGDPAAVFDRALVLLLKDLERAKHGATDNPRASRTPGTSRRVPAAVRRKVWARDGGQCAFVGNHARCTERGFLEYHHVVPYASGGNTTVENIELRCRAHNQYEAVLFLEQTVVREEPAVWRQLGPDRVEWG
jgi:hypothetical protein